MARRRRSASSVRIPVAALVATTLRSWLGLALLHQVADGGRGEQDLVGRDHARRRSPGHEPLGDDRRERARQLQPDLRLLIGREHVDDAVERLRRRRWCAASRSTRWPVSASVSVDRDRLEVAHLADEHDVGVLTQRAAQRAVEDSRVDADLALVHHGGLVLVHVLDRVLDGDDVARARRRLIRSIMRRQLVDLPDPVGPVTSTSPWG